MGRKVRMTPSTNTATLIVRIAKGFARLGRTWVGRAARTNSAVWSRESRSLPPQSPHEVLPSSAIEPHAAHRSNEDSLQLWPVGNNKNISSDRILLPFKLGKIPIQP